MRKLEQSVSQWQLRASELERERDAARESAATANRPYHELERAYQKEVAGAQGDEGAVGHSPRSRPCAARAAGRHCSPVVVCAEIRTHAPGCRPDGEGEQAVSEIGRPE